ncbi:MAG: hypothetical protein A2W08_15010 [Candidatus Rokubacteria bacterium RBG_16_73_20]|nr:MAG: hypothetical protein A2050_03975 [Candidatus Rokubacteria bacterium GWA2_73_35]OGK91568.1 MAG: hypothetical protein A2W08_15010 [Candidatus Rokubacteria bacterium RBG_16_73_20]
MVELERRGIPTVLFTAQTFVHDAHRSAASFGLPGLPLAVVPLPFTNQKPEDVHRMAEAAFDQVVAGLTKAVEARAVERPALEERLAYEGDDLLDAWGRLQADFLKRGWGDGFPLVAPTERAVAAMLRGTKRAPGDQVAVLEPGFGIATVEKLAINAVLAGCGPEHLPLLIAAVRCLAEPKMYIRNKAMSTGPHAPLVLVNGPKGRVANINSGMCALGPGAPSASNTVLGRAVRLTMMNVGHTYVGVSDMDTIGSPVKYACCCAENEAESPWEPYHVTRGFPKGASTVTVHFVYGICELHDFRSTTPEDLVRVFATAATNVAQVGTGLWLIGRRADPRSRTEEREHNTLFICPEHAQIFHKAGWGRRQIQEALYREARLPFKTMMLNKEPQAMAAAHPELGWMHDHPDLPIPVVEDPGCFDIAVVGAAAGRGTYFYGAGEPVTLPVED